MTGERAAWLTFIGFLVAVVLFLLDANERQYVQCREFGAASYRAAKGLPDYALPDHFRRLADEFARIK